ncbi:MAG: multiheme c-type cytochrome [Acidobacteriota bacterium]
MSTRTILLGAGVLGLLAVVAYGVTHWQGRDRLALDYVVTYEPSNPEVVDVRLQVRHLGSGPWTDDELILGLQVQDLYRADKDVFVDGERVEAFQEESERIGSTWTFTRYRVVDRGDDFEVRYQARIGVKEGKATKGFSGIRIGIAEPDLWVAPGASMFLYPVREPERVAEVSVRVENRGDHPLHTPWPEIDGTFYPEVHKADRLEALLTASMMIGPAERRDLSLGETDAVLEVVTSERIAPDTREEVVATIGDIANRLYGIFAPEDMERLVVFVTPRDIEGYDLLTPMGGRQVAVSLDPPTPSRWRHFSKSLADVFVRHAPYRREVRSREDFWLIHGLPRYFAEKSLDWIDVPGFEAYIETAERNLERNDQLVLDEVHTMQLRYVSQITALFEKSVAVLDRIDRRLLEGSKGEYALADALHAYFVERRSRTLLGVLEGVLSSTDAEDVVAWMSGTQKPISEPYSAIARLDLDRSRTQAPDRFDDHLRIVHIARHRNFLENCGCKTNLNGGVARLTKEIDRLRRDDPELLLINGGDIFPVEKGERLPRPMTREESQLGLNLLADLEFDVMNIRLSETIYGVDYFQTAVGDRPLPFLNSDLTRDGLPLAPPVRVVKKAGLSIGFLGLSTDSPEDVDEVIFEDGMVGLEREPREAALDRALAELEGLDVDLVVLLCSLAPKEIAPLLEGRDIDLVVTSVLPEDPHAHISGDSFFLGDTAVVHSDIDSYGYTVTDLYLEAGRPVAAGSVVTQLTEDLPESQIVRARLDGFYRSVADRLETTRYLNLWTHEVQTTEWVGVESCTSCHQAQHQQWSQTSHATAFQTLVKRRRQYYPNCVECHVTGFDLANGFRMAQGASSPWLGIQCEMCHGPASKHVREPTVHSLVRTPEFGLCRDCHNDKHSDMTESNFSEYYAKVVH